MYIDKIIKREVLVLIVSVIVLVAIIIGVSFALFFSVDEGNENIINVGDLEVTFCNDNSCDSKYDNYGKVIGTVNVNGVTTPKTIYPYMTEEEALLTEPYIFNIKNTGSLSTYLTIRLNEDKDFLLNDSYVDYISTTSLYADHVLIGISNCTNEISRDNVSINKYSDLDNNIIINSDYLDKNESKTYCLWTWLDNTTPNGAQNTYFVANLNFDAEYLPNEN